MLTNLTTEARELCAIDIEKQPIHAEVIIEELCNALEKGEAELIHYCMEHLMTDTPSCPSRVPLTNADRIRSMSDEELATWILKNVDCDKENIMCCPELYKTSNKCNGRCLAGRLNWLKQEVKE